MLRTQLTGDQGREIETLRSRTHLLVDQVGEIRDGKSPAGSGHW
jgi:hypothetical protein